MGIYLAKSKESRELLANDEFCRKWAELYRECLWATVFQDIEYLKIWYENYQNTCEFILVYETDAAGNLVGLLPLAKCLQTNKLFIAGEYHSEYQTWLATEENGNNFIEKALDLLSEDLSMLRLQLIFLAPNTPLEWLKGRWGKQIRVQNVPRPLVDLNGKNSSEKSLRKRGNKTRIRQLKKLGELKFEEIKSVEKFSKVFDVAEDFSHLRLSAVHNVQMSKDENRKSFHLDLMKKTDVVYPTVLKVGEKVASAQVGFRNRDEMLLCMTSMSPFFAKQSPSKIHLLMFGQELTKTDHKTFDLSPGGGYKERFATDVAESHILTIFFDKTDYLKHKTKRSLIKCGREKLENFGVKKTKVFKLADKVAHKLKRVKFRTIPGTIAKNAARRIYENKECRMYSMNVEKIESLKNPNRMNIDSIKDLLKYRPSEGWQDTTSKFHQKVLDNFEAGIHSYTYAEGDTLLHYGWLLERQEISKIFEVGQEFKMPPNTSVLFDYFTHPKARGKGLYQKSILQGLHDAAKIPGTEQVFIGVMADNSPSRHVIEKLGFKYEGSLFNKTRFGIKRKWQMWNEESNVEQRELVFKENYGM